MKFLRKNSILIITAGLLAGIFAFGSLAIGQTGGIRSITDKISTSWPEVEAVHEISFTSSIEIPSSSEMEIDFKGKPESSFYFPEDLNYEDISFWINEEAQEVGNEAGPETVGVSVTHGQDGQINFTLADELTIQEDDTIEIVVGTQETKIVNPPEKGSYRISISVFDQNEEKFASGTTLIAILDPVHLETTVEVMEPIVTTEEAIVLGIDTALLQGQLVNLGLEDSVQVFFEYRQKAEEEEEDEDWIQTGMFTVNDRTDFNELLGGLERGTTYEYRAGVEWYDEEEEEDLRNYGEIVEFTTPEEEGGEGDGTGDGDGEGDGDGDGDGLGDGEEDNVGDGEEDGVGDGPEPGEDPGGGGGTGGGTGGDIGPDTGGGTAGGDRGPEPGGEPANPPPPEIEDPPPHLVVAGWAYPGGEVVLYESLEEMHTVETDSEGAFIIEENEPLEETQNFLLLSEDDQGKSSTETTFTLTMDPEKGYVISDYLLSPTIELDRSSVDIEQEVSIFGRSVPGGEVEVRFFEDNEEEKKVMVDVDDQGDWELVPDLEELGEGRYDVIARAEANQEESAYTRPITLSVGVGGCVAADITGDGRVALPDFSIMMSVWGTDSPQADLNNDGVVDLTDFSILMSCWTG